MLLDKVVKESVSKEMIWENEICEWEKEFQKCKQQMQSTEVVADQQKGQWDCPGGREGRSEGTQSQNIKFQEVTKLLQRNLSGAFDMPGTLLVFTIY